jgi:hypothetical protein
MGEGQVHKDKKKKEANVFRDKHWEMEAERKRKS